MDLSPLPSRDSRFWKTGGTNGAAITKRWELTAQETTPSLLPNDTATLRMQSGRVTAGAHADLRAATIPKVAADKRDIEDIDDPITAGRRGHVGIIAGGKERSRLTKTGNHNL